MFWATGINSDVGKVDVRLNVIKTDITDYTMVFPFKGVKIKSQAVKNMNTTTETETPNTEKQIPEWLTTVQLLLSLQLLAVSEEPCCLWTSQYHSKRTYNIVD